MKYLIAISIICATLVTYAKSESYVLMKVATILPTNGQSVVMLKTMHEEPTRYLPIFIGDAEALNIYFRLTKKSPPRPLTLDLLESIIKKANIKLIEVRIEQIMHEIFFARVLLKCPDGSTIDLDSRTSDAIGLALGLRVPIKIRRELLNKVGIRENDLVKPDKSAYDPAYEETL